MSNSILNDLYKVANIYADGVVKVKAQTQTNGELSEVQELAKIGYSTSPQNWFKRAMEMARPVPSLWRTGQWHAEQYLKPRALEDVVCKVLNSSDSQAKVALLNALDQEFTKQEKGKPLSQFHQDLLAVVVEAGAGLINTAFSADEFAQVTKILERLAEKTTSQEIEPLIAALQWLPTFENAKVNAATSLTIDPSKSSKETLEPIDKKLVELSEKYPNSKSIIALQKRRLESAFPVGFISEIDKLSEEKKQPLIDQLFEAAYTTYSKLNPKTPDSDLASSLAALSSRVSDGVISRAYLVNPNFDFFRALRFNFEFYRAAQLNKDGTFDAPIAQRKNTYELVSLIRFVSSEVVEEKKLVLIDLALTRGNKEAKPLILEWLINNLYCSAPTTMPVLIYAITDSLDSGINPQDEAHLPTQWKEIVWKSALKIELEKNESSDLRNIRTILRFASTQEIETFFKDWLKNNPDHSAHQAVLKVKNDLREEQESMKKKETSFPVAKT